jgi:hypothetical protein
MESRLQLQSVIPIWFLITLRYSNDKITKLPPKHEGMGVYFLIKYVLFSRASNTFSDWRMVSFHEAWNQSTSFNRRQSLNELTVMCEIAEERGKRTHQPRAVIWIRRNQLRNVESMVLKMSDHEISKSRTSSFKNVWILQCSMALCLFSVKFYVREFY